MKQFRIHLSRLEKKFLQTCFNLFTQLALSNFRNGVRLYPSVFMSEEICLVAPAPQVLVDKRKAQDDPELNRELKKAKLETKALKAKRPGFTDDRYNETSYYIENGEILILYMNKIYLTVFL
ncbi:hypothetical protein GE061_010392 [Apolygus lucorum]|uniref:Uncharacterized protein n=1 Tax=Apolygus lucorum TaxID=248454 RepID=A0A8S9Y5L1_APOLU|nr:hypothetical protein GE061_010392 [Apolygus lucorum]